MVTLIRNVVGFFCTAVAAAAILLLGQAFWLRAAPLTIPHSFSVGQSLPAPWLNDNFAAAQASINSVNNAQLLAGAVTTDKIASGTIQTDRLAAQGKIPFLNTTTFAGLGSPATPFATFCVDCGGAAGVCVPFGPGRWAYSNGTAWVCPLQEGLGVVTASVATSGTTETTLVTFPSVTEAVGVGRTFRITGGGTIVCNAAFHVLRLRVYASSAGAAPVVADSGTTGLCNTVNNDTWSFTATWTTRVSGNPGSTTATLTYAFGSNGGTGTPAAYVFATAAAPNLNAPLTIKVTGQSSSSSLSSLTLTTAALEVLN